MGLHRLVETFENSASRCRSLSDLSGLMEAVVPELGFARFALVQGLWFHLPQARLIRIDNYGDYAERFIAQKYYQNDPVMLASQRASKAFPWRKISDLIGLGRRQIDILREADRHGLGDGLTLPVSVPGEPAGTCSFATANALPSQWNCRAATLVGATAFHEARRLCGYPFKANVVLSLSPRKLEILQCAAIGKSDPEIAMIYGLSRTTIETYMAQLRRAFDVGTRTQLCVIALRLGLVAFEDVIRRL